MATDSESDTRESEIRLGKKHIDMLAGPEKKQEEFHRGLFSSRASCRTNKGRFFDYRAFHHFFFGSPAGIKHNTAGWGPRPVYVSFLSGADPDPLLQLFLHS